MFVILMQIDMNGAQTPTDIFRIKKNSHNNRNKNTSQIVTKYVCTHFN